MLGSVDGETVVTIEEIGGGFPEETCRHNIQDIFFSNLTYYSHSVCV